MALIGHIKEISTVDGQLVAIIETGSGPAVTATIMPAGNLDFQPLPGDTVVYHHAGQEVVITAVFCEDSSAGPGEAILFARSGDGVITAIVHLKADGTVNVGEGSDFVAMSAKVDALWTALYGMFTAWTPLANDGGAALKTQFDIFFPPPGPSTVASSNLRADP